MATALLRLFFFIAVAASGAAAGKFSAAFFFGDSIFDTGNNAFFTEVASARHHPYGCDFPGKRPTGRFSNGMLVPDMVTAALGLGDLTPPFLNATLTDDDIRKSCSFASAGSGFDDNTASRFHVLSVSDQLKLFEEYVERLANSAGERAAAKIIERSLIAINSGSNDFTSYYDSKDKRGGQTIDQYQDFILSKLEESVEALYNLGGRSFVVVGLPPFGCAPKQITTHGGGDGRRACVEQQNGDAQEYNRKLEQDVLPQLRRSLPGAKMVYMPVYDVVKDVVDNADQYGFREAAKGCCGTGLVEAGPLCNRLTPVCGNRSEFVFFDALHPTERVYRIVVDHLLIYALPKL